MFDSLKQDSRPKFHGWAPGNYIGTCHQCSDQFQGDKRAVICADCAYSDIPEGYKLVPIKPTQEMIQAAEETGEITPRGNTMLYPCKVYKAMLEAADEKD